MLSSIVGEAVISTWSIKNILQFDLESENRSTFSLRVGLATGGQLVTQFMCTHRYRLYL